MRGADISSDLTDAINQDHVERIIMIIERHWSFLIRGDLPLLGQAMRALPLELLDQRPVIGLVAAVFQPVTETMTKLIEERVSRVLASYDELPDDQLRRSAGLVAVVTMRRYGMYREAAEFGRRVAELADRTYTAFRSDDNPSSAAVHIHVGLASMLAGDLAMAERDLLAAYGWPSPLENHALDAAGKLAFLYALEGEVDLASNWIDQAKEHLSGAGDWLWRSHEQGALDAAQALLALDRLDWPAYNRHNRPSVRFKPSENWTYVLYIRARAALLLGNQRLAIERIHQHRDELPHYFTAGSLPKILLDTAEADLWMSLGMFDRAEQLTQRFGQDPLELATLARLRLLTRRSAEAATLLDESAWPATTSRRDRMMLLLLSATANLRGRPRNDDRVRLIRRAAAEAADQVEPWLFSLSLVDQDVVDLLPQDAPGTAPLVETLRIIGPEQPFAFPTSSPRLTERERLVLTHLARDYPLARIAEVLHVSPSTVKNQRKSLYRKLGATSREHAVEIGYRTGLLKMPQRPPL